MDSSVIEEEFAASLADDGDEEVRLLAALENAALQVEHADSVRLEQQIAESMDMDNSCGNQNLFGNEDFTRLDATMSSVECVSQTRASSCKSESVETIDGCSAENTFGLAQARLDNSSIKHFWETGFWNDVLDPNNTFLSSFDQNFKRPVDPTFTQSLPETEDEIRLERP